MRLLVDVVLIAAAEVGVRESGGRNRGPRVDEYIRAVGLDPERGSYSWCAAFVFWCYAQAAKGLNVFNPCPKSARALGLWQLAKFYERVDGDQIVPGCVFVIDHGQTGQPINERKGHTGIVEGVDLVAGEFGTIEGNTDPGGAREGDGVWRRTRKISEVIGVIDFTREPPVA